MALAVAAVVLLVVNTWLSFSNHDAQATLAQRQEFIGQTPQVARLIQTVATVVMETAQRDNDEKLRALLTNNGITVRYNTPAPPVAPVPEPTSLPPTPPLPGPATGPATGPTTGPTTGPATLPPLPPLSSAPAPGPPTARMPPVPVRP